MRGFKVSTEFWLQRILASHPVDHLLVGFRAIYPSTAILPKKGEERILRLLDDKNLVCINKGEYM